MSHSTNHNEFCNVGDYVRMLKQYYGLPFMTADASEPQDSSDRQPQRPAGKSPSGAAAKGDAMAGQADVDVDAARDVCVKIEILDQIRQYPGWKSVFDQSDERRRDAWRCFATQLQTMANAENEPLVMNDIFRLYVRDCDGCNMFESIAAVMNAIVGKQAFNAKTVRDVIANRLTTDDVTLGEEETSVLDHFASKQYEWVKPIVGIRKPKLRLDALQRAVKTDDTFQFDDTVLDLLLTRVEFFSKQHRIGGLQIGHADNSAFISCTVIAADDEKEQLELKYLLLLYSETHDGNTTWRLAGVDGLHPAPTSVYKISELPAIMRAAYKLNCKIAAYVSLFPT